MVHNYFKNHSLGEKRIIIHADNCAGQNKNNAMSHVTDKVILVTGGGQGLGAAICKTLAEDGATIIPVDIQKNKLER